MEQQRERAPAGTAPGQKIWDIPHGTNPWTSAQIAYLRKNASVGVRELARRLGHSTASVRHMAERQRISLRTSGQRRGLVLGQPRGLSLKRALRRDVVSGTIDADVLAQRMALDGLGPLCPACGKRPVRVASSGFCRVCHLERLAAAHEELLAEHRAQERLWAARQQLSRARRTAAR